MARRPLTRRETCTSAAQLPTRAGCARAQATGRATMTVTESKGLKKGNRVYWRGEAGDCGIITETSWDAVTIAWNNGQLASVHHGDMGEIQRAPIRAAAAVQGQPKIVR